MEESQMTHPQRSPEWFQARIGRVTGSSVGAILGLSPYQTRADVLRAMVRAHHGAPSEFTGNVATAWGTAMEPQARADYEMDTCQDVEEAGFVTFEDWLGASPDGYVGKEGLVEFKCPYGIRNDNPPKFKTLAEQPYYYAQIQVQLFVTYKGWCHFHQWTPFGSEWALVERDNDWLATNIPALRQFHAEYLSELDNEDHLAPLRVTVDTPEAHKLVAEYDQLAEAIGLAEERKKEVLGLLVGLAGDQNAEVAGRKLTKVQKAGAVSYKKALDHFAPKADTSAFKGKPSSYWQLS